MTTGTMTEGTVNAMDALRMLQEQGSLGDLDCQVADLVRRLAGVEDLPLLLGAALASQVVRGGHVCLDLARMAGHRFPEAALGGEGEASRLYSVDLPSLAEWEASLASEGARRCVGGPGEARPLILEDNHLYLRRYWRYETSLAGSLRAKAGPAAAGELPAGFGAKLNELFPEPAPLR